MFRKPGPAPAEDLVDESDDAASPAVPQEQGENREEPAEGEVAEIV
jgi:hypothetical protein